MIKIGITGNIGVGKTTVSKMFKERGVPVFNSDICAREAETEPHIRDGFKQILGDDIFVDDKLDRVKMRSIVFTNKEKLAQINNLVAPYVKAKFEKFCTDNEKDHQIVMLESAILFETNSVSNFDYIITVTASENTRIKRVMSRDNCSLEDVLNKIANQLPELEKISKADFVVVNDGYDLIESIELLAKQVDAIHKAIKYDMVAKAASNLADTLNEATKQ